MSKIIGFDRKIELDWLDAVVGLLQQGQEPGEIGRTLKERLASEIAGAEARRKTAIVLTRVWVRVPPEHEYLQREALALAAHVVPEERLILHWGMSLLAYPFFRDVAATIGNLGRLQDIVGIEQVQRRMVETWGQRTTLERAVRRVVRTLFGWQVLLETDSRGQYRLAPVHLVSERTLALWLMHCGLKAHPAEHVLLPELGQLPYLFPFDLSLHLGEVRRCNRFEVSRQGLDLEMVSVRHITPCGYLE